MIPLNKHASTILTCIGAIGMVVSTFLAVKETPKALEAEKAACRKANGQEVTKIGKLCATLPHYIPSIAIGAGSLVCIFGANALNLRHQASLRNSYAALLGLFENYREQIRKWHGDETDEMAMKSAKLKTMDELEDRPPWDEVQAFYLDLESPNGTPLMPKAAFFERTKEQVMTALYYFNREFVTSGVATVNDLLRLLELDPIPAGENYGWDVGVCIEDYEASWLDFSEEYINTEDGLTICSISTFVPPCDLLEAAER